MTPQNQTRAHQPRRILNILGDGQCRDLIKDVCFNNRDELDDQPYWEDYFERRLQLPVPSGRINAYWTAPSDGDGPVFVMQHGAGSSGMSFAPVAKDLSEATQGKIGVLSLDARGHGLTNVAESADLSLDSFTKDFFDALQALKKELKWSILPEMILVGHR